MNQKELDYDLKQDYKAREEHDAREYSNIIRPLIEKIENERKKHMKKAPQEYTQKRIAQVAFIGCSTYQTYVNEDNNDIKLKTLLRLANALDMDCSINLKPRGTSKSIEGK